MTKKAIYAEDLLLSVRDDPSINGVNFARFKRHIESAPDVREELTCRENNSNGLCDRADKTKEENNTKSTKFRCIMEKDENGFPVRKFVRDDEESPEPECFRYGNYMVAEEDKVQAAKEELLKGIFDVIKKVSEDDRFWIVKKLEDNKYTVGWSIDFPHMYFNEKIKEENNMEDIKDMEAPNRPTEDLTFGEALEAMKDGLRVARKGWNGKGMYIFLAHETDFVTDADLSAYDQLEVEVADMLVMKTAQDTFQPGWLASQADMLAEDWYIV